MSSRQMPTATMLFGDWSTVSAVEWGVLAIEVNPFTDFKAGIIGIRAIWSMDVIVVHRRRSRWPARSRKRKGGGGNLTVRGGARKVTRRVVASPG